MRQALALVAFVALCFAPSSGLAQDTAWLRKFKARDFVHVTVSGLKLRQPNGELKDLASAPAFQHRLSIDDVCMIRSRTYKMVEGYPWFRVSCYVTSANLVHETPGWIAFADKTAPYKQWVSPGERGEYTQGREAEAERERVVESCFYQCLENYEPAWSLRKDATLGLAVPPKGAENWPVNGPTYRHNQCATYNCWVCTAACDLTFQNVQATASSSQPAAKLNQCTANGVMDLVKGTDKLLKEEGTSIGKDGRGAPVSRIEMVKLLVIKKQLTLALQTGCAFALGWANIWEDAQSRTCQQFCQQEESQEGFERACSDACHKGAQLAESERQGEGGEHGAVCYTDICKDGVKNQSACFVGCMFGTGSQS